MSALAAGITAATGLAQTGLNLSMSGSMNRKTRQFAKEQSNLQYYRSLNMMQMQNEYNSPAAQVERLKQAGLNVGLMYQNGAGAGGTSAQPAAPEQAQWSPTMPDTSGLNLIAQAALQKAQIENIEADTKKKNEEAGNISQDTKLKESMTRATDLQNTIQEATSEAQIIAAYQNIEKNTAEIKVLKADELLKSKEQMRIAQDMQWQNTLNAIEVVKRRMDIAYAAAKTDEARQNISLMRKQVEKLENDMEISQMNMVNEIKKTWIEEEKMFNQKEANDIMQRQLELDTKKLEEVKRHNEKTEKQGDWKLIIDGVGTIGKIYTDNMKNMIGLVDAVIPG